MPWTRTDAWVLASVVSSGGELVQLLAAADAIGGSVPSLDDLSASLDRLSSAGLISTYQGLAPTPRGHELWHTDPDRDLDESLDLLLAALNEVFLPEGRQALRVDPALYEAARAEYDKW
ncbi:MAG: hypothetical protein ACRDTP_11610 [Mycobacteriales bacterium]